MTDPTRHALPDGRRIAVRAVAGSAPGVVFLPGYMSDMAGTKAQAVFAHARAAGRACLLLDYSGCGASDGDFADATLSGWRDEVIAAITALAPARLVLVGSSLGGWLMLLVALAIPHRLAALVGIAPAPDFTQWGTPDEDRPRLTAGETVYRPNAYGPEPTPMHARFWRDAQAHRLLDGVIALDCPVRLLHGQRDADVPAAISLRLAAALRSDDVQVTLVKDGDHRLSRDRDIALLLRTLDAVTGAASGTSG